MNQQHGSPMPLTARLLRGQFNQNAFVTMLVAAYLFVLSWLFINSRGEISLNKVVFTTFIFLLLGGAWWNQVLNTQTTVIPWKRLAERIGLQCEVGGFWSAYAVQLRGKYRGRSLKMYTREAGYGGIPFTRIDVKRTGKEPLKMKIRGPFEQKSILYDKISLQLMGDVVIQKTDVHNCFVLGSDSEMALQSLRADSTLWCEIARLKQLTTIEITQDEIIFEKVGIERNVGQLHLIYDLLSDLADTLQHQ